MQEERTGTDDKVVRSVDGRRQAATIAIIPSFILSEIIWMEAEQVAHGVNHRKYWSPWNAPDALNGRATERNEAHVRPLGKIIGM